MKIAKTLIIAGIFGIMLGMPLVAAYNFWLNQQIELQATTHVIDNILFRLVGSSAQVKLEGSWFTLEQGTYSISQPYITILTEQYCSFIPTPHCDDDNGGSGGGA